MTFRAWDEVKVRMGRSMFVPCMWLRAFAAKATIMPTSLPSCSAWAGVRGAL
ncbi:hypothetical protein [Streptomyces sp. NPDC001137]|uniref:hypothetical protein n=1 Tax=Streptomyces sp. NPDC001137 TaxID=3154378 RepID=UPI0033241DAC